MGLQFRLLGPFEVRDDDRPVPVTGVKPRQLLATLLLTPGRTVSVDQLIEVLWPVDPPRSAAANIQTYVSGLRTSLGDEHVVRCPPGYAVAVGSADLDVTRFLHDAEEAARLRRLGRLAEAQHVLEGALDLWRGQPLADLPASPLWRVELDQLAERRLTAISDLLDLRIRLGDAESAVARLRGLTAEHPLREGLWALLIRALVTVGRRADALGVYAEVSRTLADELGVSPGPELRRLHTELLAADGAAVPPALVTSPPQLPAEAAVLLRGLAAFGDVAVPAWFAPALVESGEEHLARLVAARLVVDAGADALGQRRYRVPVLVRMLTDAQPTASADDEGLLRVLGGLLSLAEQAAQTLPASPFGPGRSVAPRWKPAALCPDEPAAWFAAERATLLTAIEVAGRLDRGDFAWELALAMQPWCDLGNPDAWAASHEAALAICKRLGDQLGTAVTLRGLGQLHLYRDEYAQADAAFGRARLLFAQLGQVAGVASALAGLGAVHRVRGELDLAVDYYQRALDSYVECADEAGQAYARGAIGQVWLARGDLAQARTWLGEALDLAETIGDHHRTAHVRQALGTAARRAGQDSDARHLLAQALDDFTRIGDVHGEAYALVELGRLDQPPAEAADRLIRALRIYQRLGDRRAEADTAERLGHLHGAAGQRELASAYLDEARRLRADFSR